MTSEPLDIAQLLQVLTSLILVLGVIFAAAWFFRRYGRMGSVAHDRLRVLAGISVGQRERILIVQAGEVQMLLGVAPGRVQTLHVFDEPVIDAQVVSEARTQGFGAVLKNELRKKVET